MREELPAGWATTRLGELADYINGAAFKPEDWHEDGRPIIRIQNLTSPHRSLNRTRRIVDPKLLVRRGDLLFSWSATLDAFIWDREDAWLNQHIFKVVPRSGIVDQTYLYHLLRHEVLTLVGSEHLHGSTMRHINRGPLLAHEIILPPLAEQRRIVARIKALFARIRQARADLSRVAPLARKYRDVATEQAFQMDKAGGWTMATAGELSEVRSGITLGKRHGEGVPLVECPYLRVANVQRGRLKLADIKTIAVSASDAKRLELRTGDVLMNEGGDRDKLGRGWVWEGQIEGCIHQNHVFRLRLRDGRISPKFLSRYANQIGASYFLQEGKQTTNLASISMAKVAALPVPVPPPGVAVQIDRALDVVEARTEQLSHEATRALALLDHLERTILARAFRGELVPQDPSDEPAAVAFTRSGAAPAATRRSRRAA